MTVTVQEPPRNREHARPLFPQLEAEVIALALREPERLEPGGLLAEVEPSWFIRRPEYGDVLRHLRELPPARRRSARADEFGEHRDLVLALREDAPWSWRPRDAVHQLREDAAEFARAAEQIDAWLARGWSVRVEAVDREPAVWQPGRRYSEPEPVDSIAAETARALAARRAELAGCPDISYRGNDGITGHALEQTEPTDHDRVLMACERPRRVHLYDHESGTYSSVPVPCGLRTCSGCGARILARITRPIASTAKENPLYVTTIEAAAWPALKKRISRAGACAKRFPLEDGTVGVVTTLEVGNEVDGGDVTSVLETMFTKVAQGARISTVGAEHWQHSTDDTRPMPATVEVLGIAQVSHLKELDLAEQIVGTPVMDTTTAVPVALQRRTWPRVNALDADRLRRACRVIRPDEARDLLEQHRAGRALDAATRDLLDRVRSA